MEQTCTERPRRRVEPNQRARAFDEAGDAWPTLRVREPLEARLRRQKAALEAQNHHLQEGNRRKTAVVAHAAHELRTPLTAIIGALELVLEGNVGPLAEGL